MAEEFENRDFKSKRLEKRFIRTMETLAGQPDKSIWFCSENRAEAKAIYRLLGNEQLDREEILRTHREATARRMVEAGKTVLLVQDTTSLNYSTHRQMEGIGYISDRTLGIIIHTCLAVTSDGLVLGVVEQTAYSRAEPRDTSMSRDRKKSRPLEAKESRLWVQTQQTSTAMIPEGVRTITVCDREGDMYELFWAAEKAGQLFLVRVAHNRMTVGNERILTEIVKKPCAGRIRVQIPRDSRRKLKEREAVLQMRYDQFEIQRPQVRNSTKGLGKSIEVTVIHVREEQTDDAIEPIEWFLMTNEAVDSVDAAYEKVEYYMRRWKIEEFHYVLKSGCAVEKLQERSVDKTVVLVLMYSIIAAAMLNLTFIARLRPQLPCTVFFEEEEWQLLYHTANKTKKVLRKPYTIGEAVTYLGQLGGPKRAPSDGPPGVKTIWMGLEKLYTLLAFRQWLL